jgi:3-hydroxyethyl bacteriochlorophyllide a dehydrogenase
VASYTIYSVTEQPVTHHLWEGGELETVAVVFERPEVLSMRSLALIAPTDSDIVVDVAWSGISTGTERLLFTGRMPPFPGLDYPLVPGYESVGRVRTAGPTSGRTEGELVFVPGARCYTDARGLFGGAARHLIVPGTRATPLADSLGDHAALLALAATAQHAIAAGAVPDLIIGHGALGRLLARLALIADPSRAPTVWETNPIRATGNVGYDVVHPDTDPRRDYRAIYDVSGDPDLIDTLVMRLAPGGEICLAGFYERPVHFAFPPAFLREARFRIAAEWKDTDLTAVAAMASAGTLSLDGLITHRVPATAAASAYETAFTDPHCVKMILDWRQLS